MPFTIHASKDGERAETQRITGAVAAEKARNLAAAGWDVYVTDAAGRQFQMDDLPDLQGVAENGQGGPISPRRSTL